MATWKATPEQQAAIDAKMKAEQMQQPIMPQLGAQVPPEFAQYMTPQPIMPPAPQIEQMQQPVLPASQMPPHKIIKAVGSKGELYEKHTENLMKINTRTQLFCIVAHLMDINDTINGGRIKAVIYIGIRPMAKPFDTVKLESNALWKRYLNESNRVVEFHIIGFGDNYDKLWKDVKWLRDHYQPFVMGDASHFRGAVMRIDDGTVYHSMTEAAKANGIHISAMSNHLNNRPGYQTIHGKTFRKV